MPPAERPTDPAANGAPPVEPVLVAQDVSVVYRTRGVTRHALSNVSFTLERGKTLAIVGESGAGKSTLTRVVAGLERPATGSVRVLGKPPRLRAGAVSPVQIVFQHPQAALNPYTTVGDSIAEPLQKLPRETRRARVAELLEQVGLDPRRADEKPTRFSGGQLQRIVLARALAANPALLICDEATSALDVSVQAQIANLLLDLQAEKGFACLLVTHDLGLAHVLADDVLVLQHGNAVETGDVTTFFAGPTSDYAQGLLAATREQATEAV
ncbi:MAG TPA: dipeptide/oligopeptide/nickel ABC transporter ATP-binding protein [Conexibacter sp.]|jgi:ABC-type dipeptide/oligopeptide/nickel transport system ATPase subunit|nr:dipeptide/oligopeptide/nickel ABC transporter ATP-binding protein [Conexibacter sp.]